MLSFLPLCRWSNMMALPLSPLSPSQPDPLQPSRENICINRCDRLTLRGEGGGLTPDGKSGKKSVFWGENLPKFHSMALRHCCSTELIIWKRLRGNLHNDPLETVNHPAWELTLVTECETQTAEKSYKESTIWWRKGTTTFTLGNPGLLSAL